MATACSGSPPHSAVPAELDPGAEGDRGSDPVGRPPQARTVDVVDTLFGTRVADPYRWMEGTDNPEFRIWFLAQGAFATRWLERLPARAQLQRRVRELGLGSSTLASLRVAGGRSFYLYTPPGAQRARLMVQLPDGEQRLLVDPEAPGDGLASGQSIDDFAPSPDGRLVAYNLGAGGAEVTRIRVVVVDTGRHLDDVIDRVWSEFEATWMPDGRGFFYTQMEPRAAGVDPMLNQKVRFHRLGTPADRDPAVMGRGVGSTLSFAPEEFPLLAIPPGTNLALAVAAGARWEIRLAVARLADLDLSGAGNTPWRPIAEYRDGVVQVHVHRDRLYLVSRRDAPNQRLLSIPADTPDLARAVVELDQDRAAVLRSIAIARDALYLREMIGGQARIRRMPWTARGPGTPQLLSLPFDGWVEAMAANPAADGITIQLVAWTAPPAHFRYLPGDRRFVATGVAAPTSGDWSRCTVERVEVASFDGEAVPLTILRSQDAAADGARPTILYGYASYGISETARFTPTLLAWLERGGAYAICHARGGGEKGFRWQQMGSREHKMNGVRDFIACAEYLVDSRHTTPGQLMAAGGSMGAIVVGRALTERPDLFAAAQLSVGFVNPVRMMHAQNGANQKAELGDPEMAEQFPAIYRMDPYHHVKPGVAYPAVLFTVGLEDGRVSPWMSGKMAARLQVSSTSGRPVLIRVDEAGGHGFDSSRDQEIEQRVDVWAFFLAAAASR